ncbi:MAG: ZIP family metal transporter [Caldisericia bacterium]|nr:ZIP family metal transporter [Caldisericia bacterium]
MNSYNPFLWIALFAISSAIINAVGIMAVYNKQTWTESVKTLFMCFASGVLIAVPLMYTLPKASIMNSNAGIAALVGFLFMHFSNYIIQSITKKDSLTFGLTAIEGIGIHSFIDGLIYTITFTTSALAGVVSGIGLVVHEFAEGVITYSVLMEASMSPKKAVRYALIVSSFTTPIGAFIAYPFIQKLSPSTLGLALGFVSGVLIYVSASHLLPEARSTKKHPTKHSIWAFLAGIALAIAIVLLK